MAATKYWWRQNIGSAKILALTEMFAATEMEATKILRRQNSHVDKILLSTKYWCRCRRISLLFCLAESTAADFSQTSLMISYVSQKVLILPHAVAKCAVVPGRPAFMGGLSSVPYQLVVPAHHAENITNFGANKISVSSKISLFFRQTIAVYISAHSRPAKNW